MSFFDSGPLLRDDTRAVSEVIGFLLVFALLIILLSINQAQIVPQENSEIEFQHFEEVRNDLIGVRAAISTAGQSDVSQFPTVTLGTTYPTRVFAVNPPASTGTLQTTESYPIIIENETGTSISVPTRFLEYQPRYNELDAGPTYLENSVLYTESQDGNVAVIIEEQNLVTNESTLKMTALQKDFRQSGTGRVTVELYPIQTPGKSIPDGNLTVETPTRLTGEQYWDDAFENGEQNRYLGVVNNSYDPGVHRLRLNVNTSNESQEFQFNTVGIRSEPSGGAKQNVGTDGNTDTSTETPKLGNSPPTADFTVTEESGNDQYTLNGGSSNDPDGSIAGYEWEWTKPNGKPETATTEIVSKVKIQSGTDVTLTVTDNDGATDSETKTVPT